MGIPMKQYTILFLCSSCLSVPNFLITSWTVSSGIKAEGKCTSMRPFPANSSVFRRADNGGIDFSPHSSYGILLRAWFP